MDSFTDIYFTLCIKILYDVAYCLARIVSALAVRSIVSALAVRSTFRWLLRPFHMPHPFDL